MSYIEIVACHLQRYKSHSTNYVPVFLFFKHKNIDHSGIKSFFTYIKLGCAKIMLKPGNSAWNLLVAGREDKNSKNGPN